MTTLVIQPDTSPETELLRTEDFDEIASQLLTRGVRLERWQANFELDDAADSEAVLAAYDSYVRRLRDEGFDTVDVVRLIADPSDPQWPDKAMAARSKFLDEHTHADDEVRFFVEGKGAFYLRIEGEVLGVVCEAGDLISVPAGVTHWFDMGSNPHFTAIRFFRIAEGWVGKFTGDDISSRFPSFEALAGCR